MKKYIANLCVDAIAEEAGISMKPSDDNQEWRRTIDTALEFGCDVGLGA